MGVLLASSSRVTFAGGATAMATDRSSGRVPCEAGVGHVLKLLRAGEQQFERNDPRAPRSGSTSSVGSRTSAG